MDLMSQTVNFKNCKFYSIYILTITFFKKWDATLLKSKILIRRKPPFLAPHPLEKSGIRIFQLLVLTRCKEEPIKRISEPKAAPL